MIFQVILYTGMFPHYTVNFSFVPILVISLHIGPRTSSCQVCDRLTSLDLNLNYHNV